MTMTISTQGTVCNPNAFSIGITNCFTSYDKPVYKIWSL